MDSMKLSVFDRVQVRTCRTWTGSCCFGLGRDLRISNHHDFFWRFGFLRSRFGHESCADRKCILEAGAETKCKKKESKNDKFYEKICIDITRELKVITSQPTQPANWPANQPTSLSAAHLVGLTNQSGCWLVKPAARPRSSAPRVF